MAYLEENLTESVDFEKAAQVANCSEYHFSRMFSFLAGIGLAEYVRRRRLTLAAAELRDPRARVLDVALKYGYTSADSFTRAFQALHGVPPSRAREATLKAFPKMTFQLSIQGATEMKYRILEKASFRVVGSKKRVPLIYEGVNPEIAAHWKSVTEDVLAQIRELSDQDPPGVISAVSNFSERLQEQSQLDHWIGAATSRSCPQEFEELEVAPTSWAVFESSGSLHGMQSLWARIYSEWFPASGFQHSGGPELVWYETRERNLDDFRCEIWVPVRRQE